MAPGWPQRASRRAQEKPKTGSRAPKSVPRAAQEGPKRRLFGPRREDAEKCLPPVLIDRPQDGPKRPPRPPHRASKGPQEGPRDPQKGPQTSNILPRRLLYILRMPPKGFQRERPRKGALLSLKNTTVGILRQSCCFKMGWWGYAKREELQQCGKHCGQLIFAT